MPIYEYQCAKCGRIEEVLQKCSDSPLTQCEYCSGNLKKIVSHSSFHLKGTGWYVTDYAGKADNSSSGSEKAPDSTNSSTKDSEAKASNT